MFHLIYLSVITLVPNDWYKVFIENIRFLFCIHASHHLKKHFTAFHCHIHLRFYSYENLFSSWADSCIKTDAWTLTCTVLGCECTYDWKDYCQKYSVPFYSLASLCLVINATQQITPYLNLLQQWLLLHSQLFLLFPLLLLPKFFCLSLLLMKLFTKTSNPAL